MAGEFSSWLQMIFKTDLQLWYDLDSISALTNKREIEWRKINNADFLTRNEKREAFGYTPLDKENLS